MLRSSSIAFPRFRLFAAALTGAVLALAPAAEAQRGTAGHGGFSGGHAGFSGGHVGGFAGRGGGGFGSRGPGAGNFVSTPGHFSSTFGPHSFSTFGPRSFSTAPRPAYAAPGYRSNWDAYRGDRRSGGGGWNRRDHDHDGDRYRRGYGGYGYGGYGYAGFPYFNSNSWEVLPWDLGYPDFSGDDAGEGPSGSGYGSGTGYSQDQPAPPPEDDYRPGYGAEPAYAPAPAMAAAPEAPLPPEPELTLILNDGKQVPIRNYVVTSTAVIDLDEAASGRQTTIPLSSVNLAATQKSAQQAGIDFAPPA